MTALANLRALVDEMRDVLNDMRPISPCLTEQMEGIVDRIATLSPAELGGVVAWCQADDPLSRTAFSWPGTARNPAHTTPLYATPRADEAVVDDAVYTEEEVAEAMEVLRGRHGSSALVGEVLDDMERVLRAALSPPSPGAAK